jgi:hypothetical protein
MKKSKICGMVAGMATSFFIGGAVAECVDLIMDKIDEKKCEEFDDHDFKENHKIYRGLIKTGLYLGATGIGLTASSSLGDCAEVLGTLIFKD